MKKILFLLLLCLPILANAQTVENFQYELGENYSKEEIINGSSLYVGNVVSEKSTIEGIFFSVANSFESKGTADYALSLSMSGTYSGNVLNDAYIGGNIIEFTDTYNVGRDLYIFASVVTLDGTIGRNVTIFAQEVIINELDVLGDVTINAPKITINENVKLNKISHNADAEVSIAETALIGEIIKTDNLIKELTFFNYVEAFIISYVSTLITFLAFAFITPKLFKKIETKFEELSFVNIFSTIGIGAFTLILIPIIVLLLISLVFGISLAILLSGVYIAAIFLATIFSGYLIGLIIYKLILKKEINVLLAGLIGITIVSLLTIIPGMDIIFMFIFILLGMGIFIKLFFK